MTVALSSKLRLPLICSSNAFIFAKKNWLNKAPHYTNIGKLVQIKYNTDAPVGFLCHGT